ncbi:TPA: LPXTG cell wall anchor domain-containing protein [Streptococcus suis]|nr:LPXTG cell wall anchor domain-containing protein [Streptococcus suis]HEM4768288.1 LPXTG cell wall anchor domain-containing protein [Streptococcus suis]HEM6180105.1 LPXTG cell wall anchor domain-containing protein [Streptococcus suis]HEM6237420.1 LPXTG cell wall anchor domain-containing protein [Streptococcus suis]HEM6242165.1 LPXTG cell wall anchor domain-containing protein [Streptococcus suis]
MKRSSRKKRIAKWSKLGLSLAAVTVLGGLVEPVGLTNFGLTKVYATEQADPALEARKAEIKTMIQSYRDLVGQIKALNPADYTEESWNRKYEGDVRIYLGAQSIATAYNDDLTFSSLRLDGVDSHQTLNELNATYMFGYHFVENSIPILKQAMADLVPISKSVETPIDTRPVGTPVEQPVEQPLETPVAPQPASGQPTVEERFDVLQIQYREDETDEFMGDDVIKVYSSSPKKITPPAFEGYEIKEASVGENYLMYSKPISLPYEHRFAQVLTEQDLQSHSNFLGGKIKVAQDSLRNGSVYTYILNYRRTSPVQQDPQAKRVRFEIVVKPDGAPESGFLSYDSISRRFVDLHPGESYTFPVDESKFEIRPNQKLTYSYDEVEAGKDYSISVRPKAVTSQPAAKPIETPTAPQSAETPVVTSVDKPVEIPVDSSVTKPAETPAKSPAETPTNQPSADRAEQSATEPTVLSEQDSQAGTVSPTGQSASEKQAPKQGDKEQAAPASPSKQATAKSAPTSQPQAKSLPATGEAHSVLHMTGMSLLGLAGLVVKRRSRKSS